MMLASIAERKQPRGVCAAKVIKSTDILQLSSSFFTFLAILLHKHTRILLHFTHFALPLQAK
jgi:hypothetical protein